MRQKKNEHKYFSFLFLFIEHVPVDNILRQLGVDPYSIHHPTGIINSPSNIISYITNIY
jgi:hypothetical protein